MVSKCNSGKIAVFEYIIRTVDNHIVVYTIT